MATQDDPFEDESLDAYEKPVLKELSIVEVIASTACSQSDPTPCASYNS